MSQVAEIKDKNDILDVVGERISLQRAGKNFRALCPFHSERSPSFYVSPELQSFICFGCSRKGDVLTFIQEFDRLTFREALELLADRAGITLEQDWHDPREKERKDALEALALAQQYYAFLLNEHEVGEVGRAYLKERGAANAIVKGFGLGLAPTGWDQLTQYLVGKKKFSPDVLIAAGLALRGQGGKVYDRFRHRLMFPLHDHRGRVVGFSGRLLDSTTKEAKYINTPETLLYHKRELLYGYHQNLEAIREKEAVIVVEGEFDMLSSVQAHVKNIVAIKGSILTAEQVQILARTVKTIYLALDADAAGVEATMRAIEIIQSTSVQLRVIPLTGGKDPDEIARQQPGEWRELTQESTSAFTYVLAQMLKKHDVSTAAGQRAVADTLLALVNKIEHAVERTFYFKELSEALHVNQDVLEEQLKQLQRHLRVKTKVVKKEETEAPAHSDKLGEYVLELLIKSPRLTATDLHDLAPHYWQQPVHQRLFHELSQAVKQDNWNLSRWAQSLPAELQPLATELYVHDTEATDDDLARERLNAVAQLKARGDAERRQRIADDLAQLETKAELTPEEKDEYDRLSAEFVRLTQSK